MPFVLANAAIGRAVRARAITRTKLSILFFIIILSFS